MPIQMKMKKNKYKIEFHVHTSASHDSILLKYFLLLMCKLKKINCLAIADHNEIKNALKYKKFFEKKGIQIIVSEEILTKDGEIIGLYLKEKIEPNLTVEETINEIKKQKGLVYVPHPFDKKRNKTVLSKNKILTNKDKINFIECYNGRNVSEEYNQEQEKIAIESGITKLVGSDAHTFYEIGRNYCLVNSLKKETLEEAIKNATFKKSKCIKFAHFNTKIVRLFKLIKGGKWNELSRIINKKLKKSK